MYLSRCVPAIYLLCAAGLAQTVSPQPAGLLSLREDIRKNVAAGPVPGLSVAVAEHGKILWQEGFGWANVERHEKATQDTRFYIASVTKTITATALMKLNERGQLRLDDPVNNYLGSAKIHSPMWDASAATIRLVASHRAGLTTFTRWCVPGDHRCDIDEEIKNYGVLVWPPGEVFDYSNLGYGILGRVIERSSGRSLDEFLRKEIFLPLGMSHCGFEVGALYVATQYNERTRQASQVMVSGHPAASGLRCSASDLLRFGMFHLKDRKDSPSLLADSDIDAMHEAQPHSNGQYGLGWWTKKQAGYRVVSAEGGTADSFALVELLPSQDIAVVVIANSYSKFVNDLGDRLVSALIPGFAIPASAEVDQSISSTPASPLRGDWVGQILTPGGAVDLSLNIAADGSVLGALGSEPKVRLTNVSLGPGHLYGGMPGSHLIADAPTTAYIIELDLALRDKDLAGAATSTPPHGQDGDQLPHWVKLSRAH